MSGTEWSVVILGLLTVAWINWYFFLAQRGPVQVATASGGVQEIEVQVRGGYQPAQVRVRPGVPVRLVFDRQEDSSCSEEVVIADFGIRRFLPAFARTAVEFTPSSPGSHEFTCGMGMLRGRVTVEEGT